MKFSIEFFNYNNAITKDRDIVLNSVNLEVKLNSKAGSIRILLFYIYIVLSFYEIYFVFGSLTKYFLMGLIFILLISYKMIRIEVYHLFIILWLIFKIVSLLWSNDVTSYVLSLYLISQVGMVLFFIVVSIVDFDYNFVYKIVNFSLYTSVSMAILGLFFSESYRSVSESRQVLTLFGIQNDPNNLSAFYLIGVTIALYNIIFEKKQVKINVIFVSINTIAMFLTASRAGLLSLLLIIIFVILLTNKKEKKLSDIIIKIIIISIISIILYYIASSFLSQSIFDRLFDFSTYEGGSGRENLWSEAMYLICEKPFFGWGWGGAGGGFHNTFLTMMCEIGVVGTLLFFIPVGLILYRAIKLREPLSLLLLIAGLTPSFFIDAINKRFFWNGIILAIMLLNSIKCKPNITENKGE